MRPRVIGPIVNMLVRTWKTFVWGYCGRRWVNITHCSIHNVLERIGSLREVATLDIRSHGEVGMMSAENADVF